MRESYLVAYEHTWTRLTVPAIAELAGLSVDTLLSQYSNENNARERIWSARLGTGLFGLTNCPAGNRGPTGANEIILGVGDVGLEAIIDLGFITCPVCTPDHHPDFSRVAKSIVQEKYGMDLAAFTDKTILPYDARRVEFERILSHLDGAPGRLYLPQHLEVRDIVALKSRFSRMGCPLPEIGYYDPESPVRFTAYDVA